MNEWVLGLLALLPIAISAILLLGLQWPAKRAMPVTLAVTVVLALFVWEMSLGRISESIIQGLMVTVSVLWIIFGAIFSAVLHCRGKEGLTALAIASKESSKTVIGAGFVLMFTIPMVRIFINSGVNLSDIPSMPVSSAELFSSLFGAAYPLVSPLIGALGAFIAGSNTVSNMMFSQFQFEAANSLGISTALMVSTQAFGAAAGNMIAIHNVVAASATVGLLGQEGTTLRKKLFQQPTTCLLVASLDLLPCIS